jgi:hypothetical protein
VKHERIEVQEGHADGRVALQNRLRRAEGIGGVRHTFRRLAPPFQNEAMSRDSFITDRYP